MHPAEDASGSLICFAAWVRELLRVIPSTSSVSDAVRFIEDFGN